MKTHIQIRSIGKPQNIWMKEAIKMYQMRCNQFGKLELLELPEGHQGSSKPDLNKTKKSEAQKLMQNLPEQKFIITLDETGKQLASVDFANLLKKESFTGKTIIFQIGGSWGLDKTVLQNADMVMSLGKITVPHSLARIILLEQIYRAHMILENKEYHK